MRLTNQLNEKCIVLDSNAESKEQIIESLVRKLCDVYDIDEVDGVLDAVKGREKKMSTGIGCGLAVPHAKIDLVNKMCIVAMTLKDGVDFHSIDKKPVHLLFLIVSPPDITGPHIRALSSISKIMADAEVRKGLIDSVSSEEFYNRLRLGEEKYI